MAETPTVMSSARLVDIKISWIWASKPKYSRLPRGTGGIDWAILAAVQPVLPRHLGAQATSTIIGLLFDVATLVSIIANPIVGRCVASTQPRLLIGIGIVAVVAALLVLGWPTSIWQIAVGMGLLGLSSAMLLAPATTLISEQGFPSNPPTLGDSFALYNLAYAAGLAIGPLLTGFDVQQTGFTTAMAIAAAVIAAIGGVAFTKLPGRQNITAHENSNA
ncbi:MFS transporter [Corynebacterium flavescens]|uniref:MFS transporter n=1 Tax=Corynebacterium flavescens TaxID=28028 RepID=UPI003FD61622